MQKILFITTSNLTTNPRLLKEVNLAVASGVAPTVVCFDFDNWTTSIEEELRTSLTGVKFSAITATRKAFRNWALATGLQLMYRKLNHKLPHSLKMRAQASDKRSYLLEQKLKNLDTDFDLIVSHNLGALYPAYAFAKKSNIPFAFDIEDYHPGETVAVDAVNEVERRESLLKNILPKAFYVSYASPLIGEFSLALVPEVQEHNHFLVNNSFPLGEFQRPLTKNVADKISFVWFSQNIAAGRGLELVVPVLYRYKDKVQLTLIGNLVPSFYEGFLKMFDDLIQYRNPLTQQALHLELAKFDSGLAVEISNRDLNKDIASSNKIFAYAQAGLYIMATDTSAQKHFINQNSSLGVSFPQSEEGFEIALQELLAQKEEVLATKQQRFEAGKSLAWEHESSKLLAAWKSV
ncbi:hypothetical protein GCM10023188_09330 [Pontibacter saemangeumensis]|uniref:Uncharacterized protein n=1 Tax=Pontibacter saemangeumensis TaxID=1084525 RepID=A0ABP8LED5_9BACT